MENIKPKDSESLDEFKKNIQKIENSDQILMMYVTELTTDKGYKLTFSHWGKDKLGNIKAFYIFD